jgi:hypothetical protein
MKEKIKDKLNIATEEQMLLFEGKPLIDEKPLLYYNIKENSILQLIGRLRGGVKVVAMSG